MKKLTIDSLDALFNYISKPSTVFWLRDKSYEKQLYISPSFEQLWGIPCATLYEQGASSALIPATFIENKEGAEGWNQLNQEKIKIAAGNKGDPEFLDQDTELLLKIKNEKEGVKFIIDYHYLLVDDSGEHVGFAGFAEELTQETWYAKLYSQKSQVLGSGIDPLKKHIFDILQKEAGVKIGQKSLAVVNIQKELKNGQVPLYVYQDQYVEVTFSERESQCIYYLLQGKSAKQTADFLHISTRTVEFHLGNAKEKTGCRSKLELMSKVRIKS